MLLEATDRPIRYKLLDGREIRLEPGQSVDVPAEQARKLLSLAGATIRVVAPVPACPEPSGVRVEPTIRPWPVCWESMYGSLKEPAMVEALAESGGRFWVCVTWQGMATWVRDDRLRAKPTL